MLEYLEVEENVIEVTIELLIKTLLPMALRSVTETTNSMIQATGHIGKLGTINFLNLLLSFVYGYLIIAVLELGINGYCLVILIYELTSFMVCIYFYYFELDEEIRDYSLSILENLWWQIWEIIKMTSGTMYNIIAKEMLLIILAYAKEADAVSPFIVLYSFANILIYKSISVTIQPTNTLNYLIAKKDFDGARRHYLKYLLAFSVEGVTTGVLIYFSITQIFIWLGSEAIFIESIDSVKLLLAITTFFMDIFMWTRMTMQSMGQKVQVMAVNVLVGVVITLIMAWYLVVDARMGIVGIYISYVIDYILRFAVLTSVMAFYGFGNFNEIKM